MGQIKKHASAMFADVKLLLVKHKDEGIENTEIEALCDETVALLTASDDFFAALLKRLPTETDIKDAEEKKSRLVTLIRGGKLMGKKLTV